MLYNFFLLLFTFHLAGAQSEPIKIGSKRFSENYILAEMMAQILEENGFEVERKFGLGGTMVAYNAITSGEIDVYPDYTGTIIEAILQEKDRKYDQINSRLVKHGLETLDPIGLNNTYCIIVREEDAKKFNLVNIGDLSGQEKWVGGLTAEFQGRSDGWLPLRRVYGLSQKTKSIEVPLNYEALKNKKIEFADAFSTDPLIQKYNFRVLKDPQNFFPKYEAVPMIRKGLDQKVVSLLNSLAGRIDDATMISINARVLDGASFETAANEFLIKEGLVKMKRGGGALGGLHVGDLILRTKDHILLTIVAVLLATIVAVPLATVMVPYKKLSQFVLGFTGIMQTIPSIALLTFMIPFFGIGFMPALVGLFVYSLLPIVRNTYVAMTTIDPRILVAARGIGLYPMEILFSVKLPLAFPTILTGIRTATTLNIGTATLAAFIGAGGLGEPIVTGLSLNDTNLVLQGAIPAALLAIIVDGGFSLIDKFFTKDI